MSEETKSQRLNIALDERQCVPIGSTILSHSLPSQTVGPEKNPIKLLIREYGIPFATEISMDEPRSMVFLEDVSNGGWEAALIKPEKDSQRAVGFEIKPGEFQIADGSPTFRVSEFELDQTKGWIKLPANQQSISKAAFALSDGSEFLAGLSNGGYENDFPQIKGGVPFVYEIHKTSNVAFVHWVNDEGLWETTTFPLDQLRTVDLLREIQVVSSLYQEMLASFREEIGIYNEEVRSGFVSDVPDPLEGIILGENRQERYRNFYLNVLSEIWPPTPDGGEYADDLHISVRFDSGDLSGYTQFGPHNRDLANLTPLEFEQVVDKLGTSDYVRVRAVPPHIISSNITIVPTGGSCVIETQGERTIAEIKKGVEETRLPSQFLPDFARRVAGFGPTITHISGGILGGQDGLVHFNESDMWTEKLVSYGIPKEEAQSIVSTSYERINHALDKRSRLINPRSVMLNINFDELDLNPNIKEWVERLGIPYNPVHRIQEVIYTYVGPRQLELLKNALVHRLGNGGLTQEEMEVARRFLQADFQVRMKQIDHGRWGSMNLPKEVLVGLREPNVDELSKMTEDPAFNLGVRLMRDVNIAQSDGGATALYLGFADLPGDGNRVQHEDRDMGHRFKGKPGEQTFLDSVEAQLNSPARLHRHNVDAHLQYLSSFLVDNKKAKEALVQKKASLLKTIGPIQAEEKKQLGIISQIGGKIDKLTSQKNLQQAFSEIVDYILNPEEVALAPEHRLAVKTLKEQKQKALESILSLSEEELKPADREDIVQIPILINILDAIEKGEQINVDLSAIENELADTQQSAEKSVTDLNSQIALKHQDLTKSRSSLSQSQKTLTVMQPQIQRVELITEKLKIMTDANIFPLSENPIVYHAMNFLWDSDFVFFLNEAARLQSEQKPLREGIDMEISRLQNDMEIRLKTLQGAEDGKRKADELRLSTTDQIKQLKNQRVALREPYTNALRELMLKIFPKLETYLLYLYDKIDDQQAFAMRETRVFSI